MTILFTKKIACAVFPELAPEQLVARWIYECGAMDRHLFGSLHKVLAVVPRAAPADVVEAVVAAGVERTLADVLVPYHLKRDQAPHLLVTARHCENGVVDKPRLTNLRELAVVCDTEAEVAAVAEVAAAYRAEAGAVRPGSSIYALDHAGNRAAKDKAFAALAALAMPDDFFAAERARLEALVQAIGGSRAAIQARAAEYARAKGYDEGRTALLVAASLCLAEAKLSADLPITNPAIEVDPHTGQPAVEWYGVDWNPWVALGHVAWIKPVAPVRLFAEKRAEGVSYEPERPSCGPDKRFPGVEAARLSQSAVTLLAEDLFALHADPVVLQARQAVAARRAETRSQRYVPDPDTARTVDGLAAVLRRDAAADRAVHDRDIAVRRAASGGR